MMAVIKMELGLRDGIGWRALEERTVDLTNGMVWESTMPGFIQWIARNLEKYGDREYKIRLMQLLPVQEEMDAEPQDDTDHQFYTLRRKQEQDKLFKRIKAASENDLCSLVFFLSFDQQNVQRMHEALDQLEGLHAR